jgi:hypothetical protein
MLLKRYVVGFANAAASLVDPPHHTCNDEEGFVFDEEDEDEDEEGVTHSEAFVGGTAHTFNSDCVVLKPAKPANAEPASAASNPAHANGVTKDLKKMELTFYPFIEWPSDGVKNPTCYFSVKFPEGGVMDGYKLFEEFVCFLQKTAFNEITVFVYCPEAEAESAASLGALMFADADKGSFSTESRLLTLMGVTKQSTTFVWTKRQ